MLAEGRLDVRFRRVHRSPRRHLGSPVVGKVLPKSDKVFWDFQLKYRLTSNNQLPSICDRDDVIDYFCVLLLS